MYRATVWWFYYILYIFYFLLVGSNLDFESLAYPLLVIDEGNFQDVYRLFEIGTNI